MSEAQASYPSISVCGLTLRLLPPAPYCARYTPETPVAGFAFESQHGVHAFASDRVRAFHAPANGLAFTPAGCSIYSEAPKGGEYLTMGGAPDALAALLVEEDASLPQDCFTGRVHPAAVSAAHALRRLMIAGESDAAELQSWAAAFLDAMRECGHDGWHPPAASRSLTQRRLAIVEDLIEAHLEAPLTLSDMARSCGLSPGFFLRAFKAATGQTPHRFLMERRVARARRLLRGQGTTATQAAHLAGFSSHAHMATAFRRVLGIAPSAYRRGVNA